MSGVHTTAFQVLDVVKHDLDISSSYHGHSGGSVVVYTTQICFFWGGCSPQCQFVLTYLILSAFCILWKGFTLPPLSVHARLCQAVVHDAKGSHPSWESILTWTGAGLARVPDGHLRKLLLHNSQIHLRAGEEIKKSTDEEIFAVCVWKVVRATGWSLVTRALIQCVGGRRVWSHRCDTRRADGVFPLLKCVHLIEQRQQILNKGDWWKPDIYSPTHQPFLFTIEATKQCVKNEHERCETCVLHVFSLY